MDTIDSYHIKMTEQKKIDEKFLNKEYETHKSKFVSNIKVVIQNILEVFENFKNDLFLKKTLL